MTENILEVRNLVKDYGDFSLKQLNFDVPRGSIVGLIGENGAGKSTTINCILNEVQKNSGEILLFGKDYLQNEVENKNSYRLNPYIHKVLVTYRYDISYTVASILRVPQYSQDYSLLIYAKQARSGMRLTMNSIEDFNYEGIPFASSNNRAEQYVDVALHDPKYVVGNYIFKEAYGTSFENMIPVKN